MDIQIKEKQVEDFYNRIALGYGETHTLRICDLILEKLLLENLPVGKLKILDAGGGIGRFSQPLLEKGNEIVLSDISKSMLHEAQKRLSIYKTVSFVKESVIKMNHEKEIFDVVLFMNAVLDYCGDYIAALREALRVLKKGGYVMGNVNNRLKYCQENELNDENFDLFERNMQTGDRYIIWANQKQGHLTHEFMLDELKLALLNSGFKIIKILGPFNLLSKYQIEQIKEKEKFIKLQMEYAKKEEYLNISDDFFFIAQKV